MEDYRAYGGLKAMGSVKDYRYLDTYIQWPGADTAEGKREWQQRARLSLDRRDASRAARRYGYTDREQQPGLRQACPYEIDMNLVEYVRPLRPNDNVKLKNHVTAEDLRTIGIPRAISERLEHIKAREFTVRYNDGHGGVYINYSPCVWKENMFYRV